MQILRCPPVTIGNVRCDLLLGVHAAITTLYHACFDVSLCARCASSRLLPVVHASAAQRLRAKLRCSNPISSLYMNCDVTAQIYVLLKCMWGHCTYSFTPGSISRPQHICYTKQSACI
jgi:hypothetical protein